MGCPHYWVSSMFSESYQLLSGPGWSLCFGQRSQKNREMKATVRALERFMSMSSRSQQQNFAFYSKTKAIAGHGVLMLIWRFPTIGVPPNYPFIDGVSLFSPSSYGVPPFMETPYPPSGKPADITWIRPLLLQDFGHQPGTWENRSFSRVCLRNCWLANRSSDNFRWQRENPHIQ